MTVQNGSQGEKNGIIQMHITSESLKMGQCFYILTFLYSSILKAGIHIYLSVLIIKKLILWEKTKAVKAQLVILSLKEKYPGRKNKQYCNCYVGLAFVVLNLRRKERIFVCRSGNSFNWIRFRLRKMKTKTHFENY